MKTPENPCFLASSGDIGRNQWHKMGLIDLNLLKFQKAIRQNTNIRTHLLRSLSSDVIQAKVPRLKIFSRHITIPRKIL